jgi:hypothetical protein
MAIQVTCAKCGKAYQIEEQFAGRAVQCPTCGAAIQVTIPGFAPPGTAAPQMTAPLPQPPGNGILTHIKVVGILNIVSGGVSLLWAILMVLEIIAAMAGAFDANPEMRGMPRGALAAMFGGFLLLSAIAGSIELAAGIGILLRKAWARKVGLVAGFVGVLGLWGCCVWPLNLGVGVYTLVVLFKSGAKAAMDTGRPLV